MAFQQGTAQKREFGLPRTLKRDPLTSRMAYTGISRYKSQPSIISEAFLTAFDPTRALVFVQVRLKKM